MVQSLCSTVRPHRESSLYRVITRTEELTVMRITAGLSIPVLKRVLLTVGLLIFIFPAGQTLHAQGNPSITTTSPLPGGTVGVPYSQTLIATGGTTPYTWSRSSGNLPAGLTLSDAGVISGTPTATGKADFKVVVTDSRSKTDSQMLSITIVNPPA